MDDQASPTSALENLSQTDSSLTPPRNTETTAQSNVNLSREELSRRARLLFSIRQFYAIRVAFPGATFDEHVIRSMHVPENMGRRDFINSVRLHWIRKSIISELSNMAEDAPEHMESLELAKSYVQQATNREDVLSIVKSVWRG